jgi:hypothetical protein
MSARKIKQKVLKLLATENLKVILGQLNELPVKDVINSLFSVICRGDDLVHWNGVSCMGICVARLAEKDMEDARIVMRRMLWSLNDESGGIGWGVPEAMAEVMTCHEELAREYIHMLISYMREDGEELFQDGNFLEHESLQRGLLWGIGRLAEKRPEMLIERGVVGDILPYLGSPDSSVRGLAARSLGLLQAEKVVDQIKLLVNDTAPVRLYHGGRIRTETVGQLAEEALGLMQYKRECS